jgi:hypothetical protein
VLRQGVWKRFSFHAPDVFGPRHSTPGPEGCPRPYSSSSISTGLRQADSDRLDLLARGCGPSLFVDLRAAGVAAHGVICYSRRHDLANAVSRVGASKRYEKLSPSALDLH